MRRFLAAICLLLSASQANAADPAFDMPILRGTWSADPVPAPVRYVKWSGYYLGGQFGYGSATADFSGGVEQLVANILRFTTVQAEFHPEHWASLPKQATKSASYGFFVGYNFQFENAIFGFEGNYNRTNLTASSGDTVSRTVVTSDGYSNHVTVTGTGTVHLTDYGTLRLRGGWAADNFMPYAFVGLAVGRATISRSASVTMNGVDANPACVGPPNTCLPPYAFFDSQSDVKEGAFGYGWTAGLGIEVALGSNMFVRGEVDHVSLPNVYGSNIGISSARVGAGLRF